MPGRRRCTSSTTRSGCAAGQLATAPSPPGLSRSPPPDARAKCRSHWGWSFPGRTEALGYGAGLRGERLVRLDHVRCSRATGRALQRLARGGHRTDAHDLWVHPGMRIGHQPAERLRPASPRWRRPHRGGAVIDAGGIPAPLRAVLAEYRLSLARSVAGAGVGRRCRTRCRPAALQRHRGPRLELAFLVIARPARRCDCSASARSAGGVVAFPPGFRRFRPCGCCRTGRAARPPSCRSSRCRPCGRPSASRWPDTARGSCSPRRLQGDVGVAQGDARRRGDHRLPELHRRFRVQAPAPPAPRRRPWRARPAKYMSFGSVWTTLPNTTWPTSSPTFAGRAPHGRPAPRAGGCPSGCREIADGGAHGDDQTLTARPFAEPRWQGVSQAGRVRRRVAGEGRRVRRPAAVVGAAAARRALA